VAPNVSPRGRDRFTADPDTHRNLVERFLVAAGTGDRASLQSLLAQDVTLWSDGGGKVRAALRPVLGAERVTRLLSGTFAKHADVDFRIVEMNGYPGLLISLSGQWQACSLEVTDNGLISGIQWMSNPDKLRLTLDVNRVVDGEG
jgi:RNA polymerase sigma-70 factor (ECF subfamily)